MRSWLRRGRCQVVEHGAPAQYVRDLWVEWSGSACWKLAASMWGATGRLRGTEKIQRSFRGGYGATCRKLRAGGRR
jgi:hypothetical protein